MALEQATRLNELSDIGFMRLALAEANLAPAHDDVPVGAVAVVGETVVASGTLFIDRAATRD